VEEFRNIQEGLEEKIKSMEEGLTKEEIENVRRSTTHLDRALRSYYNLCKELERTSATP
jgi:ASC-1-like (ASCH) protein